MTKAEFKNEIISFFEQKMPIKQAISTIKKKIKSDPYDTYISCSNVRVFYSDNPNFIEGGKGFYITNGKATVKI